MSKSQKKDLYRIIITTILFIPLFILEHIGINEKYEWYILFVYLIPYFIVGYDVMKSAVRNIKNGQVFDENFLMMIATFGAFIIGEYTEAVAVMFFYQIGELFQGYAVGKSRDSIKQLMNICPEYANLKINDEITEVDPEDVEIGSLILIKPGEKVPLDGIVMEGESYLDTSALTGEAVPRKVGAGEDIISGCINGNGTLVIKTTKLFEDSTVAQILDLVENATNKKAKVEKFITRFAKYYTPFVTISALLLAVFPPVFLQQNWMIWLERACIFLVVSCPCALVISVPMGFFGGIGAASKKGVLVKGSNYLEILSEVDTIVFDKTGTLTNGVFEVTDVIPSSDNRSEVISKIELLSLAALIERFSTHPIAESIVSAYKKEYVDKKVDCKETLDAEQVTDVIEISGYGIEGRISGKEVVAGNYSFMKKKHILCEENSSNGTVVYLAYDNCYLGCIIISDTIKTEVRETILQLKQEGISKTIMLTGDRKKVAYEVAKELGIEEVYYELLPQDKVHKIEEFLQKSGKSKRVSFVGDGINDAPVLARADIGFAMGSLGSDAAIEAADIVIMDDDIHKICDVLRISKKTLRIVKENIVFALGVKGMVLLLGAFGIATMWGAVFADVGVAVLAILNSMRILRD